MASFSAKDVKDLRERTGVGMMDCKKALTEADGDMDKAVEILREKGLAAANKKAGRIAADGIVYADADLDKKVGVMVEINTETDFVAKNESFQEFVKEIAQIIINESPADVDALLNCKMGNATVSDELKEKILVIGENIKIRRFVRYDGICSAYIHGGGTHGVLVLFDTSDDVAKTAEFTEYGKNIAMQIAAVNPLYLNRESVPADVLNKEREILKIQAVNEGKPENIAEKMVEGRIKKYYETNCLVEQKYVKDNDITIQQYTDNTGKDLGTKIDIKAFSRFEKGEGIEKKEEDFAAEIANMVK